MTSACEMNGLVSTGARVNSRAEMPFREWEVEEKDGTVSKYWIGQNVYRITDDHILLTRIHRFVMNIKNEVCADVELSIGNISGTLVVMCSFDELSIDAPQIPKEEVDE